MEAFIKFIGTCAILTASFFLGGFCAQKLWEWFVVPLFHLPLLGFLQAVGLAMTVKYFTSHMEYPVEREDAGSQRMVMSILHPSLALLAGWLVHVSM